MWWQLKTFFSKNSFRVTYLVTYALKWKTKEEFCKWNHIVPILLWLCLTETRNFYVFYCDQMFDLYFPRRWEEATVWWCKHNRYEKFKRVLTLQMCLWLLNLFGPLFLFWNFGIYWLYARSFWRSDKAYPGAKTINCIFTCLNSYYSTHSRLRTCNHRCPQNEYRWIEAQDKIRLWRTSQFWKELMLWTTSCKIVILLKRHAIETEHLMPFIWGKLIPSAQKRGKAFVWWLQKNSFSWVH